jgi:serine/threonine protein kinase
MESPVAVGHVLAGKYRVEQVLGSGGMGVVVAAWHQELEQRVAVKFLHPLAAERFDALERFRREARAAAKIKSEHVARVLDVGTLDGGYPYMVMEYLEGQDLASELRTRGPLPVLETSEYVLQAIEALAEAHAAGIVHRDLKPANLYVARRRDGSVCIKVLDFGISKALLGSSLDELALTKTASLIGSPLYMAPEQMRSAKDVDTRADIWSLGAILYEVLTGRPPFSGDSIPQLCASLLNEVPAPVRETRPDVPERLERAILRCLEKERQRRFPTVSELGQALVEFAPAGSRVHADRASRVLGSKDVTLSAEQTGALPAGAPTERIPIQERTADSLDRAPQLDPTVNSWSGTGARTVRPNRNLATWAAGGLALLALAGTAVWAMSRSGAEPEAATPPANAQPGQAIEPESVRAEPSTQAASDPPAPVESAASAPAVTPAPSVETAPSGARALPKKTEAAKSPGQISSPPPARPSPSAGTISDFGGRR